MIKEVEPAGRIFVCVNEKDPLKEQCARGEGEKCVSWLKEEISKRNLISKIWVTRTRCQSYCSKDGTAIIFEPTHEQYSSILLADLKPLFEDFIAKMKL